MERALKRLMAFVDAKAAWVFPDEKSRPLLLRVATVQLLCVAALVLRGALPEGLWWRLLPDLAVALLAAVHLILYPIILLKAAVLCRELRGRKERKPLEPWVLRARLSVLALLSLNAPLWWWLVRTLWRMGGYDALLSGDD